MLTGHKQTAIVFFLDETFEELEFDATSTVLEAVEYLAGVIKLQSYQTFTLYECRKVSSIVMPCILCTCGGDAALAFLLLVPRSAAGLLDFHPLQGCRKGNGINVMG